MKKLFSLLCLLMAISFTQSCSKNDAENPNNPDKPRVLEDDKATIKSSLMDMVKMLETYPSGIYTDITNLYKEKITYTYTNDFSEEIEKTERFSYYLLNKSTGKIYNHNKKIHVINNDKGYYKLNFDLLKGNYIFNNTTKEFDRTDNENIFVLKFPANAKGSTEKDNIYNLNISEYNDTDNVITVLLRKNENHDSDYELKAKLPTKFKADIAKNDAKIASVNIESIDYTLLGMPTKVKGSIYAKPFTLNVDINRVEEKNYDINLDLASYVKADKKLSANIKLGLSSPINDLGALINRIPKQLDNLNVNLSYDKLSVKGDVKNIPSIVMWLEKDNSSMEEINSYIDLGVYLEDVKIGDITASIVDKTSETKNTLFRMPDFNSETQMLVFNIKYYDESSENVANLYQESLLEFIKMANNIVADIK